MRNASSGAGRAKPKHLSPRKNTKEQEQDLMHYVMANTLYLLEEDP